MPESPSELETIIAEGHLFQGPVELDQSDKDCAHCGASAGEAMHTSDLHDICPKCLRPNARCPL